jgi:hypothetical protein
MWINIETNTISESYLDGYLPLVEVNPINLQDYGIGDTPIYTEFSDRVEFTYYTPLPIEHVKSVKISLVKSTYHAALTNYTTSPQSSCDGRYLVIDAAVENILILDGKCRLAERLGLSKVSLGTRNGLVEISVANLSSLVTEASLFNENLYVNYKHSIDAINAATTMEELALL